MGSHVLPALIRRYSEGKASQSDSVTNWGSGAPKREFLFVEDLAKASLFLLENYDGSSQVNIGVGTDLTIKELAEIVAEEVGYTGVTNWDTTKPDGTPQKLLDVGMLKELGWSAQTDLRDGIRLAIADYKARY